LPASAKSDYGDSIILYGRDMPRRAALLLSPLIVGALGGCEAPAGQYLSVAQPPARDRLLTPREVIPGRLAYADEPDAFAPVLANRIAYPTQAQANGAFQRSQALSESSEAEAVHIRLFACRPGALDDVTGRIELPHGRVVHCATDFLDARGRRLFRETVNFAYERGAWIMAVTAPPKTPAPWIAPEPSPRDYFSWSPWGRRTTPY
jgi:hypothetical protein